MPSITISVSGEPLVLDHENAMVYMFPTRHEMNHVYYRTGDVSKAIRGCDDLKRGRQLRRLRRG